MKDFSDLIIDRLESGKKARSYYSKAFNYIRYESGKPAKARNIEKEALNNKNEAEEERDL